MNIGEAKKKPEVIRRYNPANVWEAKRKDNDLSFTVADQAPDMLEHFGTLRKIAETRQNERIKNTMLREIRVIFFAFGELLQQVDDLYKENARHKAVIQEMAESTGTDPNLHYDTIRLRSIVADQLSNLKRKGLLC